MARCLSVCCLAIIALCSAPSGFAQAWSGFLFSAAPGTETISVCSAAPDGSVATGGSYNAPFFWEGVALPATEGHDVWLSYTAPGGQLRWVKSGGSILDDEIAAIATDSGGHVIAAGSFWLTATFDGLSLQAGSNPKALFLLKYSPEGQLLWGHSIGGSGIKGFGGLTTDPAGNIFVTGFFGGSLQVGDTTLTAEGTTDVFVAKISANGQWHWAFREGKTADTRATSILWTLDNQIVVAGFFNSNTRIAAQEFTANTSDRDAFIAAYEPENGQPRWAVKAGGVFDDDITALAADEQGRIYAAGYLVGVMTLAPGFSIQSATGNPDFFILQYDSNGMPLRARAMGGVQTNLATSIAVAGGRVFIAGHYQGGMTWDGLSLPNSAAFAGFVGAFDYQLQGLWAQRFPASQGFFINNAALAPDGRLWCAGSFAGQADLPQGHYTSGGAFDGFLMATADPVPASQSTPLASWRIFPNPASEYFMVEHLAPTDHLRVWSASGHPMPAQAADFIHIAGWPPGMYWVEIKNDQTRVLLPLVKAGP